MSSPASFNPNTTLGAYQIGVLVSYVLFGVTTAQTYVYYGRFPDDSRKFKALVAFVWVCEVIHALCIGHTLYIYTVSDYVHPERLDRALPKSLPAAILFSGIIAASGYKGSSRSGSMLSPICIPLLIWAMAFLRVLACTVLFAAAMGMTFWARYEAQWEWLFMAKWTVSSVNDLTITVTMLFLLNKQRINVHTRTAALMDKLITWTIETGMVTSATGIVMLACFVTMKNNFIWLAFFAVSARLFSNSLLASLNSRAILRAMNEVTLPSLTPVIGLNIQVTKMTRINDSRPYRGPDHDGASEDV
ncbi:hypothetical protein B0H14DRAFT_3874172 [Mycena olivaceomarginata]|nr:hypothetical protein B0H14DRAFT_3874172 [Mycena olivaceomarginata]